MEPIDQKIKRLKDILREMESVLISFSGGLDSAFLLFLSYSVLKQKVKSATFVSPIFPENDTTRAGNFAARLGVEHIMLGFDILSSLDFIRNDKNRCHYCKKEMIKELNAEAKRQGLIHIADGSNLDDTKDYRPGLSVARNSYLKSPLLDAGFTKADIKEAARKMNIGEFFPPPSACLASRIAYGTPIENRLLYMVKKGEALLNELGFRRARVRVHPPIARIEVPYPHISRLSEEPIREKIIKDFKRLGFGYVTLDLSGYRSGSMNDLILKPDS